MSFICHMTKVTPEGKCALCSKLESTVGLLLRLRLGGTYVKAAGFSLALCVRVGSLRAASQGGTGVVCTWMWLRTRHSHPGVSPLRDISQVSSLMGKEWPHPMEAPPWSPSCRCSGFAWRFLPGCHHSPEPHPASWVSGHNSRWQNRVLSSAQLAIRLNFYFLSFVSKHIRTMRKRP